MTKIAAIEGKGAGALLQRAILLLAVAVVVAAMATAAPAFALAPSPCPGNSILSPVSSTGEIKFDRNGDGQICEQLGHKPRDNKY
jgi:hypothetical protein